MTDSTVRLQKMLSQAGVASRRKAEQLMEQGRVTVNGEVCRTLGTKVDPNQDVIAVDGAPVRISGKRLYWVMHKPKGTICTENDPEGRQTVHSLLPSQLPRMFTVGRLDWDTEGLLLFTTDGELARELTDRSVAVPRVYEVKIQGPADRHLVRRFNDGMRLDDGRKTKPSPTEILHETRTNAWYEVILTEGMNRQIHRMAMACGRRVLKIRRVRFGPIELGSLPEGSARALTDLEVRSLINAGGLKQARRDQKYAEAARRPEVDGDSPVNKGAAAPKAGGKTPGAPSTGGKPGGKKPGTQRSAGAKTGTKKPTARSRRPAGGSPGGGGAKRRPQGSPKSNTRGPKTRR